MAGERRGHAMTEQPCDDPFISSTTRAFTVADGDDSRDAIDTGSSGISLKDRLKNERADGIDSMRSIEF